MYMRKPNPIADKITKHVLEYLLNKFTLAPGDVNNIRMIITRTLNRDSKIKVSSDINTKKNKKGPID
jgi:hypothetical protein